MKKYLIFLIFLLIINPILANNKISQMDLDDKIEIIYAADHLSKNDIIKGSDAVRKALLYAPDNKTYKLYIAILFIYSKQYKEGLALLNNLPKSNLRIFYTVYLIDKLFPKDKKIPLLLKNVHSELSKYDFNESHLLFFASLAKKFKLSKISEQFFKKAIKKDKNILSLSYKIEPLRDIIYHIYDNMEPPRDTFYYNSYGKIAIRLKDYKKSIELLKKSLKMGKKNPLAEKLLSDAYILKGDLDEALKYLRSAEKYFYQNEDIYFNYYSIYKNKPPKERIKICQRGLNQIPSSFQMLYCIAEANYKLKNLEKSKLYLEYALKKRGKSFEANYLMGEVLYQMLKDVDKKWESGKITTEEAEKFDNQIPDSIPYYTKAFNQKPFDFRVTAKIYRHFLKIDLKEEKDGGLGEIFIPEDVKEILNQDVANKLYKDYDEYIEKITREKNIIKYHDNFKLYLETNDEKYLKELKYIPLKTSLTLYLEYLKDGKKFDDFMEPFSKKYLKILKEDKEPNKIDYIYTFPNKKQLTHYKTFNFIIPDIF